MQWMHMNFEQYLSVKNQDALNIGDKQFTEIPEKNIFPFFGDWVAL